MRATVALLVTCLIVGTLDAGDLGQKYVKVQSFEDLKLLAQDLSEESFEPRPPVPKVLSQMEYEDYREIQFKFTEAIWWQDQIPFWLETFHRGFVQRDRVQLYLIEKDGVREVPYSSDKFEFGKRVSHLNIPKDAGHAGIKVVSAVPNKQEILTFLGSSYFRARSGETVYGSSTRGLAVDIALPKDEEFPFFRTFWIERPSKDAENLTILALLDSPQVCGAYRFTLNPGHIETKIGVECEVHFRKTPNKIGIAPLTSMWIWGDGLAGPPKDSRPAVHDSDGLLIQTGDNQWIWRAYARQAYPSVSQFRFDAVKGFGVLQRNRSFYHFDDHNAHYHKRPSVWIRPNKPWTNGVVELLELPGAHEGIDNIGAYWVFDEKPTTDKPLSLEYDVLFFPGDLGFQTDVARCTVLDVKRKRKSIELEVRFSGENLKKFGVGQVTADIQLFRGKLIAKAIKATDTNDLLVAMQMEPTEDAPIEVTLQLQANGSTIAEQFRYLCPPEEPEFMYPQVYTRKE